MVENSDKITTFIDDGENSTHLDLWLTLPTRTIIQIMTCQQNISHCKLTSQIQHYNRCVHHPTIKSEKDARRALANAFS